MTLGERLRAAIEEWPGGGNRAFARAMARRGVRGGTYRTLLNYMSDRTRPSPKWLEEAAEELGVREAWLARGDGERTRLEAAAAGLVEGERDRYGRTVEEIVARAVPSFHDLPRKVRAVFVETWIRLSQRGIGPADAEGGDEAALAAWLWTHLVRPVDELGLGCHVTDRSFADYAQAALLGLEIVATAGEPDR